jgi:hypothetical protein
MSTAIAEAWVERPLRRFVEDARLRFALLLHPNGQVLGQHGFTRAVDVMAACALAAAIHASAMHLGREVEGKPFSELYHAGRERQIYLAEATTRGGPLVVLAVFDGDTSLGLVQLYFRELCDGLAAAAPTPAAAVPVIQENFELELNRNLAILFGRAPSDTTRPDPNHPIA